jgi:uncharacterized protein with HEPN domain
MSDERIALLLSQIRQAANDAISFVEQTDKQKFAQDKRTQQAVTMSLFVIGEIAAKLTDRHPEFIAMNPEVPWSQMRGMRNRIAHGYFEINFDMVWETVQTALPGLLATLPKTS